MKHIDNGAVIGEAHQGQIAYSHDGAVWKFLSKDKVREISGKNGIVRLHFDDDTTFDIDYAKVLNQPGWIGAGSDEDGLTKVMEDISDWLNDSSLTKAIKLLEDIKLYQNGSKGFQVIQPANGIVSGNWYLIRTLDPSQFGILEDNAVDLAIPTVIFPAGVPLTTAHLDGNGFTRMQVSVGKVIAYKK